MAAHFNRSRTRSFIAVVGLAIGVSAGAGAGCGAQERASHSDAAPPREGDGEAARVVKVRGPGGLGSPSLPEGTFMGEGALVAAGQTVELPRGTLAELRLTDGPLVRANEGTALTMGEGDAPMRLDQGEIVLLLMGHAPVSVKVGDDELTVHDGEVLARRDERGNTFSVVTGRAELRRGEDAVSLGAGSKIGPSGVGAVAPDDADPGGTGGTGPGPVASLPPVARRSLDVLDDTRWSADFDAVAKKADLLPRGVGSLTARRAGSSVERQPLRLVDQKVRVTIDGRLAHTEVEQAFHNDSGAVMEGIYRFPLPSDASISGLSLLVGRRWMEGEMLEKRRARRIFRQIVDATVPRDPALLQWEQGNVFKLNVFPIPARGERRIKIRYTQVLPESGERVRYRYPMGGSGATATEIEHFSFEVDVAGDELSPAQKASIATPMMPLSRQVRGGDVHLAATRDHFLPTWDLGVDVPVAVGDAGDVSVQTHLDKDGQAYFMATLRPSELPSAPPRPTSYAFVLDRSHSTAPELWGLSRAMLQTLLEGMGDRDDFTLLACDTACDALSAEARRGEAETIERAMRFVDGQTLAGASDIGHMLSSAARTLDARTGDRDRVIVYLGDGVPTSGSLTVDELAAMSRRELGDARLLAVANGARADLTVLDHLARVTGGDLLRADPRDDVRAVVRELVLRAKVPAARDLELELPPGMMDVHPKTLPALRGGDELTVVGRLTRPVDGEIRLRSRAEGGRVVQAFPVDVEARRGSAVLHRHLPRTWARAEIEHLTATQGASARDVIVALSRDYTVLSRWTALLVLENDAMYRDFGVARKQADKDAWEGEAGGRSGTGTEVYGGAPATTATPAATPGGMEAAAPPAEAEPSADASLTTKGDAKSSPAPEPNGGAERQTRSSSKDAFDALEPPAVPEARSEQAKALDEDAFGEVDETAEDASGWIAADDDAEAADGLLDASRGSGASRSRGAPARKESKRKASSRPAKAPPRDLGVADPWDGDAIGGGWSGGAYLPEHRPRPRRRVDVYRIRDAREPSAGDLEQVAALRRARDAEPTSRKAHERLVKQAIYTGHPEARAFAAAWAQADPEHGPALIAHADLLAAAGEPIAGRAYASAAEVDPFSSSQHRWLAEAFASKGDWTRACSHRRALVSIKPQDAGRHADLARCLESAGRVGRAKAAVVEGLSSADRPGELRGLADELGDDEGAGGALRGRLHGHPDVRAELTWSGSADLDVVLVDRRGRRLSAMRPERVRVREGDGVDELTHRKLHHSAHIEVSRVDGGTGPVRGELKITTPDGTRRFPVNIDHGTLRIAKVTHSRPWR